MIRDSLEEEHQNKCHSGRQLQKASQEVSMWRQKYERDGIARAEEMEAAKLKLQSRLAEAQGTVETLNTKAVHLEKEKAEMLANIEETSANMDAAAQRCHQVRSLMDRLHYDISKLFKINF